MQINAKLEMTGQRSWEKINWLSGMRLEVIPVKGECRGVEECLVLAFSHRVDRRSVSDDKLDTELSDRRP